MLDQSPSDESATDQHRGNAEPSRNSAALGALLFTGVEQHDHENKEHHDRAGVNDHLHRGNEFRAQQKIFDRKGSHHRDQRKRTVDGMALYQQVDRSRHANRSKNRK